MVAKEVLGMGEEFDNGSDSSTTLYDEEEFQALIRGPKGVLAIRLLLRKLLVTMIIALSLSLKRVRKVVTLKWILRMI